ncbi:MAG: hypothetical protein IPK44_02150 [Candidatus Accumulibacter sp.]|uniref:hypothetical protein n=1 Tax=Accumulibacter sp. TaxID=2053492 RepID=UPI0025888796|nr:hypothetical protein [Accumulibacter sp.]MBK8113403.1 hypothetical protein [Accumulibacter sp.]
MALLLALRLVCRNFAGIIALCANRKRNYTHLNHRLTPAHLLRSFPLPALGALALLDARFALYLCPFVPLKIARWRQVAGLVCGLLQDAHYVHDLLSTTKTY